MESRSSDPGRSNSLPLRAPTRWTSWSLTIGTAISAICFGLGLVLELIGRPRVAGDPLDPAAIWRSLSAFEPWGWATLGVIVILITPIVSLITTIAEYWAISTRVAFLGLAVGLVLATSLLIALSSV